MLLSSSFGSKRLFVMGCLCGLLLSGCAVSDLMTTSSDTREKRQGPIRQDGSAPPPAKAAGRDLLTPALTSINNRIYTLEQKHEEWKEVERKSASLSLPPEKLNKLNECKAQLQDILIEYNRLRNRLLQESRVESAQLLAGDALLQLNQQDIDYLEGGCSRLLAELKTAPVSKPEVMAAADPQIKAAFESGDYDRVITLYGQITLPQGQVPAFDTTFQYGQSLLKNRQEALAHKVFTDLLARVRQQPGQDGVFFQLMQVIGDLNFAMGSFDAARRQYEELVRVSIERGARKEEWAGLQLPALQSGITKPEELKEYSILLKNYLAYIPKREGYSVAEQAEKFLLTYPASRLVPSVNIIHKTTREQAEAWLNQGIKRVEVLANERKAQEVPASGASAAPISAGSPMPPTPEGQAMVKGTEVSPALSAPVASPPPAPAFDEKGLQDDFDRGMKALAAKEYDKAIESFTKLLKTPYEEKARARIEEAAKLAAQEDRQKAAELFVRSTSSHDPESKRKLLLSSRDLLQGILTKYPQSGLTDKVRKNLSKIEEELKTVDPARSAVPPSKGGAYVPPGA